MKHRLYQHYTNRACIRNVHLDGKPKKHRYGKMTKDSPGKHLQQGEHPHMQQEIEKPKHK